MAEERLLEIEKVCEKFYNTENDVERKQAEAILSGSSLEDMVILLRSASKWANLFAIGFISNRLPQKWSTFHPEQHQTLAIEIISLLTRNDGIEDHTLELASKVFAEICKRGWNAIGDGEAFVKNPDPISDLNRPFQCIIEAAFDNLLRSKSVPLVRVGLILFNAVLQEFSVNNGKYLFIQQRTFSCSFRDKFLHIIFNVAIEILISASKVQDPASLILLNHCLDLLLSCVSYDYSGTGSGIGMMKNSEELSDLVSMVSFPLSYSNIMEYNDFRKTLFQIYVNAQPPISNKVIDVLIYLISVRKSCFTSSDNMYLFYFDFFDFLLNVLTNNIGFNFHENRHSICRIVAQLRTLGQTSALSEYQNQLELISKIEGFTIQMISAGDNGGKGIHYLLTFWSSTISSFLSQPHKQHELTTFITEKSFSVLQEYMKAKIIVHISDKEPNEDDDLLNIEFVDEALTHIPLLFRLCLPRSFELLTYLMNQIVQETNNFNEKSEKEKNLRFRQLCWITNFARAAIDSRGKNALFHAKSLETDAKVAKASFEFIIFIQSFPQLRARSLADFAVANLLKSIHQNYVTNSTWINEVFSNLSQFNLNSPLLLCEWIIKFSVNAIMNANKNPDPISLCVIDGYLNLLQTVAKSDFSVEILEGKQIVHDLLFMDSPISLNHIKQQSFWYQIIGGFLFREEFLEIYWEDYIYNFEKNFEFLKNADPSQERIVHSVCFCLNAFYGMLRAVSSADGYDYFVEWCYPSAMPLFAFINAHYLLHPQIMLLTLKLVSALLSNRSHRSSLSYQSSSVLKICKLAFSLVSSLSKTLIQPICQVQSVTNQVYRELLRPTRYCFNVFNIVVKENINFGAFTSFGDPLLNDMLLSVLNLALLFPFDQTSQYPKLHRSIFTFLSNFCRYSTLLVNSADGNQIASVLGLLIRGAMSEDNHTVEQCCSSLEELFMLIYKEHKKRFPDPNVLKFDEKISQSHDPNVCFTIMKNILLMLLFSKQKHNTKLYGKPFLALFLCYRNSFPQIRQSVLLQFPPKQAELENCFNAFDQIDFSVLSQKTRMDFMKALKTLRGVFKSS